MARRKTPKRIYRKELNRPVVQRQLKNMSMVIKKKGERSSAVPDARGQIIHMIVFLGFIPAANLFPFGRNIGRPMVTICCF